MNLTFVVDVDVFFVLTQVGGIMKPSYNPGPVLHDDHPGLQHGLQEDQVRKETELKELAAELA